MEIYLGVLNISDEPESDAPFGKAGINLLTNLSLEEYEVYEDSTKELFELRSESDLFTIIEWNFREYASIIDMYVKAKAAGADEVFAERPQYLEINRQVQNFLASFRTYLDHHETRIKRRYGEESQQTRNWKSYCSDAYDGSFAYRFLYALRNYSQHCGLPISSIQMTDQLSPKDPTRRIVTLMVGVDRDHILQDFDWKRLRSEVESQPRIIDIHPLMEQLFEDLILIENKYLSSEIPTLKPHAQGLIDLADRVSKYRGRPAVFTFPKKIIDPAKPNQLDVSKMNFSLVAVDLARKFVDFTGFADETTDGERLHDE
jgi:hypothetical protein